MDIALRFRVPVVEPMSNTLQKGPTWAEESQQSNALPTIPRGASAQLDTGFGHLKAWKLEKARKGAHYALFIKLDDENTPHLAQAIVDFLQGADLDVQLDREATKLSGHWAFVISADDELKKNEIHVSSTEKSPASAILDEIL